MKKVWPKILVAMVIMLALVVIPTIVVAEPDGALTLDNKDPSTWARIADGRLGTLTYYSSNPTFNFSLTATGLEALTAYSLIYYANPWPGNNPGKLIGVGASLADGTLTISGIPDLNMNLPTPPDSNMVVNHCVSPDNYQHCYGAKIWLVPSSCYNAGTNSISSWEPTRFLFETDLINYTDTDLEQQGQGVPLSTTITEPQATIGLSVSPVSLNFGNVDVGTCSNPPSVVTLTNMGNVPIKVTASTSAGFYTDCLRINDLPANGWVSATIAVGGHLDINVKICPTIAYSGTIIGSVSFVASFAP